MGDCDHFDEADDVEDADNSLPVKEGRLCERSAKKKGGGSIITVSKEKLLEASLLSLQTLGRQHRPFSSSSSLDTDHTDTGMDLKLLATDCILSNHLPVNEIRLCNLTV